MKYISILLCLFLTACGQGYSEGERSGNIVKLSHKGIFIKSWEGEMNLGGMVQGEKGMVPNTWKFHIPDGPLVDKIQTAQRTGQATTLIYSQWIFPPVWSQDSDYDVVSIKE